MPQFSSWLRALIAPLAIGFCGSLHAATATNDTVAVTKGAETPFNVLANDTAAPSQPISVISATTPTGGGSLIFSGGGLRYKPGAATTTDSFMYTIRDGIRIGGVARAPLQTFTSPPTGGVSVPVQGSGYGSAMVLVPGGGGDYYVLTDRGPNADCTAATEKVFPIPSFTPKIGRAARQADGSYKIISNIELKRPDGTTKITGLPNPANSTETAEQLDGGGVNVAFQPTAGDTGGTDAFGLDSEGLAIDSNGKFWVCDEYGPFIVRFSATGVEEERLSPLAPNTNGRFLPLVLAKRRANRGMEGLCITPSGKIVGIMQNALLNKVGTPPLANGDNNRTCTCRIVVYDPTEPNAVLATKQYVYLLDLPDDPGTAGDPTDALDSGRRISEIACISETKFLVLERTDNFPGASNSYRKAVEIDITGATDISDAANGVNGKLFRATVGGTSETPEFFTTRKNRAAATTILANLLSTTDTASPIVPVTRTGVEIDFDAILGPSYDHDKLEGLVVLASAAGSATKVALVNDDDFGMTNGAVNYSIKPKINNGGLQDYNEIAEIDLTVATTSTATVNITVAAGTPHLVGVAGVPGVTTKAVLTVGDSVNNKPDGFNPYRMIGIPDGLGAFDNGDGTFTLVMNHELGQTNGAERAHGSKGAFVSRWVINKTTFFPVSIEDHNPTPTSIVLWNGTAFLPAGTTAYGRFCSADLPAVSAFFNSTSGKGTQDRIFMNGEEIGDEGRAFGHILTGTEKGISYELPHLGKFSWENSVANPFAQDTTIVIGTDDTSSPGGQVYVYVGQKQSTGNTVEKAGLVGGNLFGIFANGVAIEDRTTAVGGQKNVPVPFTLTPLGNVSGMTGAQLQTASGATVTQFARPEDASWDPNNPRDLYFATTDRFDRFKNVPNGAAQVGRSRLWRARFNDLANPQAGGTITMLIDGSENPGPNMMDNLTVDNQGRVLLQEDPGNEAHNAKVWVYTISSGTLTLVLKHDPARFGEVLATGVTPAVAPFDRDEESSGIVDMESILGRGWYLISQQAHTGSTTGVAPDSELVERGQLTAAFIPSGVDPQSPSPTTPYVIPVAAGVKTKAIFTTGETSGLKPDGITPYRMIGIPDGLGAFDNGDGTFTLTMNHELGDTAGIVRAHGSKGAIVSRWKINKSNLQVQSIQDHNPNNTSIVLYNKTTMMFQPAGTTAYGRFCSADLPAATAFFNPATGLGTQERIFMDGEEIGDEGRAFAHIITGANTGVSYELPDLGRFSWENSIANPYAQNKTIVMGTDDTTPGQVYMYVGTKTNTGNEINRAGLIGGTLYGVFANGVAVEDRTTAVGGAKDVAVPLTFTNLGNVANMTGAQLQAASGTTVTQFLRPEDGSWDPNNPSDFYFLTTDQFDTIKNGAGGSTAGRSRLWRLRFGDITNPNNPTPPLTNTITLLIDGSENPGPNMMDNMTVDKKGRIVIQEDPGNQDHNAKIWVYNIATKALTLVAKHDPARFGDKVGTVVTPATLPFSKDEESSGIIDASDILGENQFLLVEQAHLGGAPAPDTELVERGQLINLTIPPLTPTVGAINDLTTNEDTATAAVPFLVGDSDYPASSYTFTVASSNTALVPVANVVLGGAGSNRTVTVTPVANLNGSALITITATDAAGKAASEPFTLTVTPVNDAPSFTKGADIAVTEDAGAQSVAFATAVTAGPIDEAAQTLTFDVTNDNNALFTVQPAISNTGVLTYTPKADASGSATVTVTLKDNGGTANGGADTAAAQTFTIAVAMAADAPVITSRPTATPNPAAPAQTVTFTAAATTVDGVALTFTWNFGDGTTGTGASVTHAYAAANVYTVTLTVSAAGTTLTATDSLLVAVIAPSTGGGTLADADNDGIPNTLDSDDDNDGFSDTIEAAMNSDPLNGGSRPGNQPAATAGGPLQNVKLSIKLTFGKTNADSLSFVGVLPGVTAAAESQTVIVDVGGVTRMYTLAKGNSPKSKTDTFKLGKGGKFAFSAKKVSIASNLADEKLTDRTVSGELVNVKVSIVTGGKNYEATVSGSYKATAGKGGALK